MAAAWLQRWALLLSGYQYDIYYQDTKSHSNADALSRLPLPCIDYTSNCTGASNDFNMTQIDSLPILSSQLERATSYDPVLSKVIQYTGQGWPAAIPDELKLYYV